MLSLKVHVPRGIYFGLKVGPVKLLWGQSIHSLTQMQWESRAKEPCAFNVSASKALEAQSFRGFRA